MSLNDVTYWLRALFFIGPVLASSSRKRISLALQRKDREIALHGRETGRIVRLPHGEFIEVHAPLNDYKRYRLVGFESPSPLPAEPNSHGVKWIREAARAPSPGGSSRTASPRSPRPSWRPPTSHHAEVEAPAEKAEVGGR